MNDHRAPRRSLLGSARLFLIVLLVAVLLLGGCVAMKYNGLVTGQTKVEGKWAEVQNQYKRRYDLVPQLVETVKGAAEFERSTITEVTEARASVGKVQLPETLPDDPEKLRAYFAAQAELGSSLARLLATVEAYPELKATQNFLSLQDQLEGTENRIGVARRDYVDAVQQYNTTLRKFPGNLVANSFGFEAHPQLDFDEDVETRPEISFEED